MNVVQPSSSKEANTNTHPQIRDAILDTRGVKFHLHHAERREIWHGDGCQKAQDERDEEEYDPGNAKDFSHCEFCY
jgi:hypothetical protein